MQDAKEARTRAEGAGARETREASAAELAEYKRQAAAEAKPDTGNGYTISMVVEGTASNWGPDLTPAQGMVCAGVAAAHMEARLRETWPDAEIDVRVPPMGADPEAHTLRVYGPDPRIADGIRDAIEYHEPGWEQDMADALADAVESMSPTLQEGDTILIYEDPVTQLRPEGEAMLVREHDAPPHYWRVRFVSDGAVCDRFVYPPVAD